MHGSIAAQTVSFLFNTPITSADIFRLRMCYRASHSIAKNTALRVTTKISSKKLNASAAIEKRSGESVLMWCGVSSLYDARRGGKRAVNGFMLSAMRTGLNRVGAGGNGDGGPTNRPLCFPFSPSRVSRRLGARATISNMRDEAPVGPAAMIAAYSVYRWC